MGLEEELFNKQMAKIFGESLHDIKVTDINNRSTFNVIMIDDFRYIYYDGDCSQATARREDYYLLFFHRKY